MDPGFFEPRETKGLATQPTLLDVFDNTVPDKAKQFAPALTQNQIQKLRTEAQQKDWRALAVFPHALNEKASKEWENFILKQELQHTRTLLYQSYGLSRDQCSLLERMHKTLGTTVRVLVGRTALIDLNAFMPVRSIRDLTHEGLRKSNRFLYCADHETQVHADRFASHRFEILHWPESGMRMKRS